MATPATTTCGYLNGNPTQIRTAATGFKCAIDTNLGIWGFCPNSVGVPNAANCGLAGFCVDSSSCGNGCGPYPSNTGITATTCDQNNFCATALLTQGQGQTYTYLSCGPSGKTDQYLAIPVPTNTMTTSTSSSTTSSSSIVTTSTSPTTTSSSVSSASVLPSSPTAASSPISQPSSNNTGAIVGGVIGGLAIICLTIFGVLFMRSRDGKAILSRTVGRKENVLSLMDQFSGHYAKSQWDSSYGPVEIGHTREEQIAPVELPDRSDI